VSHFLLRLPRRRVLLSLLWTAALLSGAGALRAQQTPDTTLDVIRSGDIIRLRIWREPDLSGDFDVNQAGIATLPKLGPMRVVDLAPTRLQDSLIKMYAAYLNNPSVEVVHLRRVNILGAVKNPGSYTLDPTLTIVGALALAGGNLPSGKPDKVELRRDGQRIPVKLDASTVVGTLPLRSGDQLYLPERSWITRNAGIVAALITGTVAVGIYVANHD